MPGQTCPLGVWIKNRKPVVLNNIPTDPEIAHLRDAAATCGIRSAIGLPFRINGEVAGVLHFYSAQANFFFAEDIRLAEEIAEERCSFALDKLEPGSASDRQLRRNLPAAASFSN